MLFRLYQPDDYSRLYAIEVECFPPEIRFSKGYVRELVSNRRAATWIAEKDEAQAAGEMAGFAIVDWRCCFGEAIAYIQTLEVAPKYRRQGIGAELLLRTIWSASNAGASSLWLHVAEDNAAAQQLYRAHEFLPQGREENYYSPGSHAQLYARALVPCRVAQTT